MTERRSAAGAGAVPAEAGIPAAEDRGAEQMVIGHERLAGFVAEIFRHAGCSDAEAARIGTSLVGANLAGHDSHGVIRVRLYVDLLAAGIQLADQEIEVLADAGALLLADGKHGMGQTVGPAAVRLGIERCAELGTAVVGLRNAGHLGRIGEYAEMAAEAGLVSMHLVNVANSRLVAPFGARERRMGTNPYAFGAPVAGRRPVIHDFATSIVAEGKAMVALHGGPPLPADALVSGDGEITGDPRVLYALAEGQRPDSASGPGALRAMGEHKGSGLSVMCELLAGALTGTGTAGPRHVRFANGMLSVYIDPARLRPAAESGGESVAESGGESGGESGAESGGESVAESGGESVYADRGDAVGDGGPEAAQPTDYATIAAEYLDWFCEAAPIDADQPVRLPGDVEHERRLHRLVHGVTLPAEVWADICKGARAAGVGSDAIAAVVGSS